MDRKEYQLLVWLIFLLGCGSETSGDANFRYRLEEIGEKTIFLDSTTNLISTFMTYVTDDQTEYLAFENRYEICGQQLVFFVNVF